MSKNMTKSLQVDWRTIQQPVQMTPYEGTGTIIQSSRQTRPYWFNGRFLGARDLQRDQNNFLLRQAEMGAAAGFGVIHGLQVTMPPDEAAAAETIVVSAGHGLTPAGDLVMLQNDLTVVLSDLADDENLDVEFGISSAPTPVARTRTGLFVVALRPVEFTANPITSYPVSVQGTKTTHDGNIVEGAAVSLVPYPEPPGNFDTTTQQPALARQIFVLGAPGPVSDSLLPLAMVSILRGVIQWVDQWLVRRDSGPEFNGLRRGLTDPSAQLAYLQQYDAQLLGNVNARVKQNSTLRFAATDVFQALPPAGRFPLAAIDTTAFTQLFFPFATDVLMSLVPEDELPALLEDAQSMPPIDLTQGASSYADLTVFMLVPAPRAGFAQLAESLAPVALTGAAPLVLNNHQPLNLLRFFQGRVLPVAAKTSWQQAIGSQVYGYYIRRRSAPVYTTVTTIAFTVVPGAAAGSFTLTASVSPESASGQVTFYDASTELGGVALAQGSGSFAATLAAGTHQLTAVYGGTGAFAGSTSAPVIQTV
jgi:hypothetical protein